MEKGKYTFHNKCFPKFQTKIVNIWWVTVDTKYFLKVCGLFKKEISKYLIESKVSIYQLELKRILRILVYVGYSTFW